MASKKKNNKPKEQKKLGRPLKGTIDYDTIDKLIRIGCTGEEVAAFLEVDYDTLNAHLKKEKGQSFSEYVRKGNSEFKISLRRAQFRSAMGVTRREVRDGREVEIQQIQPNVVMQIWLGKQFLGQSEKQDNFNHEVPFVIERTDEDENPSTEI